MDADDLRAALDRLHMSQAAFARAIQYRPESVWRMLNGKQPIGRLVELETERLLRESER